MLSLIREGPVGILSIDRPTKRNALNSALLDTWPDLLRAAADDDAVRVLVVTGGAGAPFCAGADIEEFQSFAQDHDALTLFCERFALAQEAMASFPKPAIAMISGPCIGGGCGLALGCDLRLADTGAKFGITPAKLGLDYAIADTNRLVEAVGFSHAAELLFSARLIPAAEALAIGLVNRVIEPAALRVETMALANMIAANAPSTLRSVKAHFQAIRRGEIGDDAQSRQAFIKAFAGPDFAEGLAAFREKRPPCFGGAS
jgi:enoyl-CoA hydratase/carnithine racemase